MEILEDVVTMLAYIVGFGLGAAMFIVLVAFAIKIAKDLE